MKLKTRIFTISSVLMMLLLLGGSFAAPDGITGSTEGAIYLQGQVKKDVTNPNNIFQGSYGTGSTFTLGDNSTNISNFRLRSGELTDVSGNAIYGNITSSIENFVHPEFNKSLLDVADWTETVDFGSYTSLKYDNVDAISTKAKSMRIVWDNSANTTANTSILFEYTNSLGTPIGINNYLNFGMKIQQNSITNFAGNLADYTVKGFGLELIDTLGNTYRISFTLDSSRSSWTSGVYSSEEYIGFGYEAVQFVSIKLSDFDALDATNDMNSINQLKLTLEDDSPAYNKFGKYVVDIFALSFTDSPIKLGEDRGDEITAASDYVVANLTDATDPNIVVRTINPSVSYINSATVDFMADVGVQEIYDDTNYRVTKDATFKLATPAAWQDQVTLSNMKLYHVLEDSYAKYTAYSFESSDMLTSILNEGAGDAILVDSSILNDVEYTLKYQLEYTRAEYDALIAGESMALSDYAVYLFWAVLAFVIPTQFFKDKKDAAKRRGRTKSANRR